MLIVLLFAHLYTEFHTSADLRLIFISNFNKLNNDDDDDDDDDDDCNCFLAFSHVLIKKYE